MQELKPKTFAQINEEIEQIEKQANRLNKTVVFEALVGAGITDLTVEFDGMGDEGQIGDVSAKSGSTLTELPTTPVAFCTRLCEGIYPFCEQRLQTTEGMALPEAIEQLCYDYLDENHSGWENCDGAFGDFKFDVAARTLHLDFNEREYHFNTTSEEL